MMKKARKTVFCLVILLLAFSVLPHGLAATSLPNSVYIAAQITNGCTIASAAMVMRSCAYYSGYNDWAQITDVAIKSVAWISEVGLAGSFSYKFAGNSITMNSKSVSSGFTVESLKQLLDTHPEGVALYCTSMPHAVFLIDYDGDIFYCADPYGGSYSGKRIPLISSRLGEYYGSQENILSHADKYWYISNYSISGDTISPVISSASIKQVISDGIYVSCMATDNTFLKKIELGVWHSAMNIEDAKWYASNATNNQEVEIFIPFSDFGNRKGVTYYINIRAWDFAGNNSEITRVADQYVEDDPPTVTGAAIVETNHSEADGYSYSVRAEATDSVGLQSIGYCFWNDVTGDSHPAYGSIAVSGKSASVSFTINVNQIGGAMNTLYHTKVWAIDTAGKYSPIVEVTPIRIENVNPIVSEARVENITPTSCDVYVKGKDNATVLRVISRIRYDLKLPMIYSPGEIGGGIMLESKPSFVDEYTFHFDLSDFGGPQNVNYTIDAWAADLSGNWSNGVRVADIVFESVAPTITSKTIQNITDEGYDVVVTANDNTKLSKVKISTWNSEMNQNNAVQQEYDVQDAAQDTHVFHVSFSDFGNNKKAKYYTDVTAIDLCGNTTGSIRVGEVCLTDYYLLTILKSVDGEETVISHGYCSENEVQLSAEEVEGYLFDHWTCDAGSFADSKDANTVFTMPASAATVTCVYTKPNCTITINGQTEPAVWGAYYDVVQSGESLPYQIICSPSSYTSNGMVELECTSWDFDTSATVDLDQQMIRFSGSGLLYLITSVDNCRSESWFFIVMGDDVLRIPEEVTTIEEEAFANTAAGIVVIPDSVKTIGRNAFPDAKIVMMNTMIQRTIADDAFPNVFVYADTGSKYNSELNQTCGDCFYLVSRDVEIPDD